MNDRHMDITAKYKDLTASNPRRPPNWRFSRASLGMELNLGASEIAQGDQYVKEVVDYLVRRRRASSKIELIDQQFYAVSEAYKLYTERDNAILLLIHGLLMGGATPQLIASRIEDNNSRLVDVIRLYELLAFDVRGRLKNDIYVADQIVRPLDNGLCFPDNMSLSCALGYIGWRAGKGHAMFDAWHDPMSSNREYVAMIHALGHSFAGKRVVLTELMEDTSRRKTAVEHARAYVQNRKDLAELSRDEKIGGEATVQQTLTNMMTGLTLSTTDINKPEELAVVMRAADNMRAAMANAIDTRRGIARAPAAGNPPA